MMRERSNPASRSGCGGAGNSKNAALLVLMKFRLIVKKIDTIQFKHTILILDYEISLAVPGLCSHTNP